MALLENTLCPSTAQPACRVADREFDIKLNIRIPAILSFKVVLIVM